MELVTIDTDMSVSSYKKKKKATSRLRYQPLQLEYLLFLKQHKVFS